MTTMDIQDIRDLLVRIDERVKAVQAEIKIINETRKCPAHAVKIKFLERMAWGTASALALFGLRTLYESFKR